MSGPLLALFSVQERVIENKVKLGKMSLVWVITGEVLVSHHSLTAVSQAVQASPDKTSGGVANLDGAACSRDIIYHNQRLGAWQYSGMCLVLCWVWSVCSCKLIGLCSSIIATQSFLVGITQHIKHFYIMVRRYFRLFLLTKRLQFLRMSTVNDSLEVISC